MTVTADHIAILVCDTPIPGVASKFGDFGDNCRDLLEAGGLCPYPGICYQICNDNDDDLEVIYSQIKAGLESNVIKGLLLTGSRSDAFDDQVPWIQKLDNFVKNVAFETPNLPIVGICFGHQILSKDLGAKVGRNLGQGWELGTTEIKLNPHFSLMKGPILSMSESHRDVVFEIPKPYKGSEFYNIGLSSNCAVQGLISNGGKLRILTFQGHPEFHPDLMLALCKYKYEAGTIDKEVYEQSTQATASMVNQGKEIGGIIGNFFQTK